MTTLARTSSQTIGPFFHDALLRPDARRSVLTAENTVGERIRMEGHVYDGDGKGVPDALVEIWQADHHGRYHHPLDRRDRPLDSSFTGFGRASTDAEGAYRFETIRPGAVPFDDRRKQAPHISVAVFSRGLLNHLYTRLYFADDPATADDSVLRYVPAERRKTLVAERADAGGVLVYRFDIVLQGANETVFFDF